MAKRKHPEQDLQENLPPYPDLRNALRRLQLRRGEVNEKTQSLIDKWLEQLARIQLEMNRLEKIEHLEDALRKQKK